MYSMKEKYRQNTNLKSSTTSTYSSLRYYGEPDNAIKNTEKQSRKHAGEEKLRYYQRERTRSPGHTRHEKDYSSMKRENHQGGSQHVSTKVDRPRGEKRSHKVLEGKYSRDKGVTSSHAYDSTGPHHHRSRVDYLERDVRDRMPHKTILSRAKDHSVEKNSVFADLSRVVRKVRESRPAVPGWNGKASEADGKDSKRWGHSGYKELYRGDYKSSNKDSQNYSAANRRSTSRSKFTSSSRHPLDRVVPRQLSRSRSPIERPTMRKTTAPHRNLDVLKKDQGTRNPAPPKFSSEISKVNRSEKLPVDKVQAGKSNLKPATKVKQSASLPAVVDVRSTTLGKNVHRRTPVKKPETTTTKTLRDDREKHYERKISASPSDSISSDSEGAATPSKSKGEKKQIRYSRKSDSRSRSRSRSVSFSSSSSKSSDDEDVLELHPRKKRKSGSHSNSSSSDYDSRSLSDSSAISCLMSNGTKKTPISSSSSSSSSSISMKSNHSIVRKEPTDKTNASKALAVATKKTPTKSNPSQPNDYSSSKSKKSSERAPGKSTESPLLVRVAKDRSTEESVKLKPPSNSKATETISKRLGDKIVDVGSAVGASKSAGTNKSKTSATSKKSSSAKKSGEVAESESEGDSESSSESDVEPRMSLSERFAKLTQMHTDKREFAKPVLSVNEIDTKMKVVRDLRNPVTKIYVGGVQQKSSTPVREIRRSRPKTPDIVHVEGSRRYTSADRRSHFERMDRDEPTERPSDWSDARVRYEYYRNRGYFNERPIEFEDYVKWEKWWFEYRDWLANEGYYDRMANSHPGERDHRPVASDVRREWHYDRRNEQHGHGHGQHPPAYSDHFDARERIVRQPALTSNRGQFISTRNDRNQYYGNNDMNMNTNLARPPISRHIGRTANGSLVINVRPGNTLNFPPSANYNNFRGRGRGRGGQFR